MSLRKREALTGILLICPFLSGFLLFYIIPFFLSVRYSFTEGIGGLSWAGLKNYKDVLDSYAFRLAAANTFRFMGIGIPLILAVSLGFSLMIFGAAGHGRLFQSIFLYPLVVPLGSAVMFIQVLLSEYGIFNRVRYVLGLPDIPWLDSGAVFYVLLALYLWKNCGYNMVIFLTGLNGIPRECQEAARLDGAGHLRVLTHVVLPVCKGGIAALLILNFADNWNMVEQPIVFLERREQYPLSIFLAESFQQRGSEIFACGLLALLPPLLLFAYFRDELVSGIAVSGAEHGRKWKT